MSSTRTALTAAAVVIVVAVAVLLYVKLNRVGGQVHDVTSLLTDQTAELNSLINPQLHKVNELVNAQTAMVVGALEAQRRLVAQLSTRLANVDRDVARVLRRFQLLFRRLLRGLRGQLPVQTRTLVAAIERGLRRLLTLQKRR